MTDLYAGGGLLYSVLSCIFDVPIIVVDESILKTYKDSAPSPYHVGSHITRIVQRRNQRPKEAGMSLKELVQLLKRIEEDPYSDHPVVCIWNGRDHFTGTLLGMDTMNLPAALSTSLKKARQKKASSSKTSGKEKVPATPPSVRKSPRKQP